MPVAEVGSPGSDLDRCPRHTTPIGQAILVLQAVEAPATHHERGSLLGPAEQGTRRRHPSTRCWTVVSGELAMATLS